MPRRLLLLLSVLMVPASSLADEDDTQTGEAESVQEAAADAEEDAPATRRGRRGRRHDYSRFSDGPRHVPQVRGQSAARAEQLGLGTRTAASRLLHRRPLDRWIEAAGDNMPEHLRWPVAMGRFGRGFGFVRRRRPELPHRGIDIVADEGSTIRAVAPGIVAYSDNGIRGFGNSILIVHPNGAVSLYAHCVRTTVQPGWRVAAGERIGFVGNTGISRGAHLHFEYHLRGRAVNPLPHFDGRPWIAEYRRWNRARRRGEYEAPSGFLATHLPADGPSGAAPPRQAPPTLRGNDAEGLAEARRLLDHGASADDLELVTGERYSNVLWPVRGGTRGTGFDQSRGVNIHSSARNPVRAVADGQVIFAGSGLRGVGQAVVILHKNGWVSLYGANDELHVEAGQQVRRGEWIAHVGARSDHLHFQLRRDGQTVTLNGLFVGAP